MAVDTEYTNKVIMLMNDDPLASKAMNFPTKLIYKYLLGDEIGGNELVTFNHLKMNSELFRLTIQDCQYLLSEEKIDSIAKLNKYLGMVSAEAKDEFKRRILIEGPDSSADNAKKQIRSIFERLIHLKWIDSVVKVGYTFAAVYLGYLIGRHNYLEHFATWLSSIFK